MHTITQTSSALLPTTARTLAVCALLTLASTAMAQGTLLSPAQGPVSASNLAPAQDRAGTSPTSLVLARLDLPDAPSPVAAPEPASSSSALPTDPDPHPDPHPDPQSDVAKTAPIAKPLPPAIPPIAGPYAMTIGAGQVGPAVTNRQKVIGGVRDTISPFTLAGEIVSAGYSHITNGSPNYGTNSLAFGSRAGASFARGSSQNLFTEAVLSTVLHEDLRYYQLGSSVPFFHRLFYAGTRPLFTRTNAGRRTPNLSLLGGYLGAAYLTRTYNPVLNQSNHEVLAIYGTSIGGAAVGDVVTEFLPGFLQVLHLNKFSHL